MNIANVIKQLKYVEIEYTNNNFAVWTRVDNFYIHGHGDTLEKAFEDLQKHKALEEHKELTNER